jgi:D-3-phosphoglycerate dehydrogenase
MTKVLVAEPLAEEGVRKLESELEVDVHLDLSRDKLLEIIAEYDAVIVRSATNIDKAVLERGSRLKVVGRAGIGLDNIDVDTATRQGILVVKDRKSVV